MIFEYLKVNMLKYTKKVDFIKVVTGFLNEKKKRKCLNCPS